MNEQERDIRLMSSSNILGDHCVQGIVLGPADMITENKILAFMELTFLLVRETRNA